MAGPDDVIDREPADWLWREDQQRQVERDYRWYHVPELPNQQRWRQGNQEYGIPLESGIGIYAGKTPSYYPPNVDNTMERQYLNNPGREGLFAVEALQPWAETRENDMKQALEEMSTRDLLNHYLMQSGSTPNRVVERIKENGNIKTEADLRKWLRGSIAWLSLDTLAFSPKDDI